MTTELENIKLEHEKAALALDVSQLNARVCMLQRIVTQLQSERIGLCQSLYECGFILLPDSTLKVKGE